MQNDYFLQPILVKAKLLLWADKHRNVSINNITAKIKRKDAQRLRRRLSYTK